MKTITELKAQIVELQAKKADIEELISDIEVNPEEYADLSAQYDEELDEIYSDVCEQLPIVVTGSELIAEHDPVMYRCGFSDFCSNFRYQDLDLYQTAESDLDDVTAELDQLESELWDLENADEDQAELSQC